MEWCQLLMNVCGLKRFRISCQMGGVADDGGPCRGGGGVEAEGGVSC